MNIIKKDSTSTIERGYDMRAQPRRRPKEENEQPLFLKKAFSMIDTCPQHLGGWSEKGDTFIVKDVKNFSEQIIPTVFKHNNFSSFVRQLNFYGFRKIKSELYSHNAQWWEFRHPHFMKGQPELLSEIKRAVHYAAPQDQTSNIHEMDTLKTQVAGISSRVADIDGSILGLTQLVSDLITQAQKRGHDLENANDIIAKKRRRLPSAMSFRIQHGLEADTAPYSSGSDDNFDDCSESYSVSSDEPIIEKALVLPRGSEIQEIELLNSDFFRMSSADLLDDDLSIEFDDYIGLRPTVDIDADLATRIIKKEPFVSYSVPAPATLLKETPPAAVSSAVADIPDILQHLSTEMQERFVDRLAESVGANFAKLLASSITPPAPAATIPAAPAMSMNHYSEHFVQQIQRQQVPPPYWPNQQEPSSSSHNAYDKAFPAMTLPLASAALCSLIAAHCSGNNANPATCLAVTAATQAAGIICNNGVCTTNYHQSANV